MLAVVLLTVLAKTIAYSPEALADEVVNLPGAEALDLNFRHFSGYIPVGSKNLHYWLVESMNDPASDPVSFWTNGGPGCSGLIGFMTEHGPFRPIADGNVKFNPDAWNQRANMVFIEAPCGVGFSYSENKDDLKTNDEQTAQDNYALILGFMERFPEFLKNDLYISSESYGGHYMPTLAKQIVDGNTAGQNTHLNFKGFAVGNPQTTFYSAIPSGLATLWGHQLISKPTWDEYSNTCLVAKNFNFTKCEFLLLKMYVEMGNLNHYALDYPVCLEGSPRAAGRAQRTWLMQHLLAEASPELKRAVGLEPDGSYDPCVDNYAQTYLNRADVKAAIHVQGSIDWEECSHTVRYDQRDGMHSMTPIYNYLLDGDFGLKILVFSGDDDDVCPTEGTQSWIWDLGYRVKGRAWQQYKVANQTAGYLTKFTHNLAFATVHGAGHEVPTYKPEIALYLWNSYLDGSLFA